MDSAAVAAGGRQRGCRHNKVLQPKILALSETSSKQNYKHICFELVHIKL